MGVWNTLHLFDTNEFYENRVPILLGKKGALENDYIDFLKSYRIGGVSKLSACEITKLTNESVSEIIKISNLFDPTFRIHKIYDNIETWDEKIKHLNDNEYYYEFKSFLEYYIFKYCADFYPHLHCSKGGLFSSLNPKTNSIGHEILNIIETHNSFFSIDGGILNWISIDETKLLSNCRKDFNKEGKNHYFDELLHFFDIASSNELGLIRGQDMRENILEKLPQYKLIKKEDWLNYNLDGIFNIHFSCIKKDTIVKKTNKDIIKETSKKKNNKPLNQQVLNKVNDKASKELKIILYKPFHSIVYESVLENKIYVSYYHESGFFQGSLTIELSPTETSKFRENNNEFINNQAKLISKDFKYNYENRNIENFSNKYQTSELIAEWKNK